MSIKNVEYYMGLPYEKVIQKLPEADGGGYFVSVPVLGTAATNAWATTPEDALAALDEVMHDNIEEWLAEGYTIPEPANVCQKQFSGKFALRMPPYLHRQIAETANAEGISINQLICNALSEFEGAHRARGLRCAAPKD